jgi:hypothetical protein
MRVVSGTFTLLSGDIDMYLGIGFIPDWVKLYSMNATERFASWSFNMMRHADCLGGIETDTAGDITPNTFEIGIQPWRGGNRVTAAQAIAGNCLTWDTLDYSKAVNHDPTTYEDITRWTYYSAQTGHWDKMANITHVGIGSLIWIASGNDAAKRYVVVALTGNGEDTNEVTLSETGVPDGEITRISNMSDMKVITTGGMVPAGFWIDATMTFEASTGELVFFEAGTYDM